MGLKILLLSMVLGAYALADIGIDWDAKQYGVIYEKGGNVELALCPGKLPELENISRQCEGAKILTRAEGEFFNRNLRAMNRVPREYTDKNGLTSVSLSLESKKRDLEQAEPDSQQAASMKSELHLLEDIQMRLRKSQHFIDGMRGGKSMVFHRGGGPEWTFFFSSFSPVSYTGKRWLRLAFGNWADQDAQCFSPWEKWRGDRKVLADLIRMGVLAKLDSTFVWTGMQRRLRLLTWTGAGPSHPGFNLYDEFGQVHYVPDPDRYILAGNDVMAKYQETQPVYGQAVDTSKFQLGSEDSVRTTFKANRVVHVPWSNNFTTNPGGLAPSDEPYDYELKDKETRLHILCVLEETNKGGKPD